MAKWWEDPVGAINQEAKNVRGGMNRAVTPTGEGVRAAEKAKEEFQAGFEKAVGLLSQDIDKPIGESETFQRNKAEGIQTLKEQLTSRGKFFSGKSVPVIGDFVSDLTSDEQRRRDFLKQNLANLYFSGAQTKAGLTTNIGQQKVARNEAFNREITGLAELAIAAYTGWKMKIPETSSTGATGGTPPPVPPV